MIVTRSEVRSAAMFIVISVVSLLNENTDTGVLATAGGLMIVIDWYMRRAPRKGDDGE